MRGYWRNKTPGERLMALEALRREYMKMKGIGPDQPMQRVIRIIEPK